MPCCQQPGCFMQGPAVSHCVWMPSVISGGPCLLPTRFSHALPVRSSADLYVCAVLSVSCFVVSLRRDRLGSLGEASCFPARCGGQDGVMDRGRTSMRRWRRRGVRAMAPAASRLAGLRRVGIVMCIGWPAQTSWPLLVQCQSPRQARPAALSQRRLREVGHLCGLCHSCRACMRPQFELNREVNSQ